MGASYTHVSCTVLFKDHNTMNMQEDSTIAVVIQLYSVKRELTPMVIEMALTG